MSTHYNGEMPDSGSTGTNLLENWEKRVQKYASFLNYKLKVNKMLTGSTLWIIDLFFKP